MKRTSIRGTVLLSLAGSLILWRILAQSPSPLPAPLSWQQQDIGATGLKGTADPSAAGWRVQGGGADIWGGADAFHFVFVPWEGDAELVARVISVDPTDPWAKAGLMVRSTLEETSPHAFVAWTPEKGATFIRRPAAGARSRDDSHQAMRLIAGNGKAVFQQRGSAGADQAIDAITPHASPRWLRLVRQGNVFRAFDSADGVNWEWLGTESLDLPGKTVIGLAVTSHDPAHLCSALFEQISLSPPKASSVAAPKTGSGDGLLGTYFPNLNLSSPSFQRVDPMVNFDWRYGSPGDGVGSNQFSVRWEGELQAQFTEPYVIQMASDDRARLWLNGDLLIDEWYEHGEQTSTALANLEAGQHYLIRIEYFENRGRAAAKLLWSSPSTPLQPIPQSQLYSHLANQNGDGLPDLWKQAHGLDPSDRGAADKIVNGTDRTARQLYESGFEPAALAHPHGAWTSQDVGRVGTDGSAALAGETWTIQGAGADIWANADAFQFVYQAWRGEGQIVARVLSQDNTDPWAKAGVTIRSSLKPDAAQVTLAVTPQNGLTLVSRAQEGWSATARAVASPAAQPWLKLVYRESAVSAFSSPDGASWTWIGTEPLTAADSVYFGLAVCSHDNSKLGTAVIDQLALGKLDSRHPVKLNLGSGDGLAGTYFDAKKGTLLSRLDPLVNFDWDMNSPMPGIGPDRFSVRWEGSLLPESSEQYALHVLSDDGARLWLDGQLLIDSWTEHGPAEQTALVTFDAGRRYSIRLDYFNGGGEALCKLLWSSPTLAKQPVPQSQLHSGQWPATNPNTQVDASGLASGVTENVSDSAAEDSQKRSNGSAQERLTPSVTSVSTVQLLAGATPSARLGRWETADGSIYAVDRRGWLEYQLTAPAADLFRIDIEGQAHNSLDQDPVFYLQVSIDGESLGRLALDAGFGRAGTVQVLTPWLTAGTHQVRIFWDNARKGRSLQLNTIRLMALEGPDANGNGIKDWVEEKLARENGIQMPDSASASLKISSAVSPACLEGRGGFLSMMTIRLADGSVVRPQHGPGNRWFAHVPLSAHQPTDIEVSYQNGGRVEKAQLVWKPTNLLLAHSLAIRKGDALLLTVSDPRLTDATAQIRVDERQVFSGAAAQLVPYRFEQAGSFSVAGHASDAKGAVQSGQVAVKVITASFGENIAAWVGKDRLWICPQLPIDALVEADPRVRIDPAPAAAAEIRQFRLVVDSPEPRYLVARLGESGPILAGARVDGFDLSSGTATDIRVVETLPDGTEVVDTTLVESPVLAPVTARLDIVVGGVMFDDGSAVKQLGASDFNSLGEVQVRFLRPALARTAVCHTLKAFQGADSLGEAF